MNDLFVRALRGETTERRPLWIMRQAGRYLPEYRALRREHSFEEMCGSPALAAEATLQPMARFPLDASIVFADLMSPVSALGIDFHFDPGPIIPKPLRTAAAIRALRVPSPAEIAPEVPATLALVKKGLAGRANLIGFAGAPWSIAAYLVEGKGGKGFPMLRALLAEDEVVFGELMNTLAELCSAYAIEQFRAGADVIQIFDSWAGLLSEAIYDQHIRPHLERMLGTLRDAGIPTIYFAQGAPHLLHRHRELPCDGLGLCWRTDMAQARRTIPIGVPGGKALQGNLDPSILLAGPEPTRRAIAELLEAVPAHGHLVNLGHGILPETPIESVQAIVDAVHAEASHDAGVSA
ncbi:MAG: uroporphyrinogen decarboxylase [Planctomycetes bacterium]|nr:uroporphyrinogen decarboxylase [Planctomycetota bacterium]MCB9910231.1 uroporphyrinogen decarboxylase [Planctomycetota bacterium]HPF12838.1 uroporphyrinogen decarboxylase [Planctomycetota bacterium]HRV81455.1 uroporphyrinogen decarboxylase [Planctomycetota bacterium]